MLIKLAKLVLALLMTIHTLSMAAEPDKASSALMLKVIKSPTCGCCQKWIDHIIEQGIPAQSQNFEKMGAVKEHFGIQPQYRSCHTAVSPSGFIFEGHVPAKFVKQFISESHPEAIGLSVPAMPVGSPGMEVGDKFMPYQILILFKDGSSKVYAEVKHYQEQF